MTNPLLTPSTLPYNLPDFAKIRLEHAYRLAVEQAVERSQRYVHLADAGAWSSRSGSCTPPTACPCRTAAWC